MCETRDGEGAIENNDLFHSANQSHGTMDEIVSAWARFSHGTDDDAASTMPYYPAKRFPKRYIKSVRKETSGKDIAPSEGQGFEDSHSEAH